MPLNPLLVASYAVAGLIDILAPVALAVFLARRLGGRWRWWAIGVLVFFLSQAVTRVPVMIWVQTIPSVQARLLAQPVWGWSFLFLAALTAGLFEEGGRWLAFRYLVPPADRSWRTALMLGAGHGGLESVLVGLVSFAGLAAYLAMVYLPPETFGTAKGPVEAARAQLARLQGWEPLLGAWERCCALLMHLAWTVLVLQTFLRGPVWWWYALGSHTLVDFTSVGLMRVAVERWHRSPQVAQCLTEGLVTVYAILAVWIIFALRPRVELATLKDAPAGPAPEAAGP